MQKRTFLKSGLFFFGAAFTAGSSLWARPALADAADFSEADEQTSGPFTLPALPYGAAALEPHLDQLTMEIHHGRHHQAYVTNLNKAVANTPYATMALEKLQLALKPGDTAVRNNGGGHYNHSLFWTLLSPQGGGAPTGMLEDKINAKFGSLDKLKEALAAEGLNRFGSGWAWLSVTKTGELVLSSTPNQDNPLMKNVAKKQFAYPILGIDVWEHAYYLKYQNKRADYLKAFWNVVNWETVAQRLAAAPGVLVGA